MAFLDAGDLVNSEEGLRFSSKAPELLQEIFVGGFPYGSNINTGIKVSKGSVSSLSGQSNNYSMFLVDATVQLGSSGGPILDKEGGLVGIIAGIFDGDSFQPAGIAIRGRQEQKRNSSGLNFGIKSSVIKEIMRAEGFSLHQTDEAPDLSQKVLGQILQNTTYMVGCN